MRRGELQAEAAKGAVGVEPSARPQRQDCKRPRKAGGAGGGVWRPPDRGLERTAGGPGLRAKGKLWPVSHGDRDH